jgi:hypothetical protein
MQMNGSFDRNDIREFFKGVLGKTQKGNNRRNILAESKDEFEEITVQKEKDIIAPVSEDTLDRLSDILVLGAIEHFETDIEVINVLWLDDVFRAILRDSPEMCNKLSQAIGEAFVSIEESEEDEPEWDPGDQQYADQAATEQYGDTYGDDIHWIDRNELVDLITGEFMTMDPGELSKQEFDIAVTTVLDRHSLSMEWYKDNYDIDYEEILDRVGEIEDGEDFHGYRETP